MAIKSVDAAKAVSIPYLGLSPLTPAGFRNPFDSGILAKRGPARVDLENNLAGDFRLAPGTKGALKNIRPLAARGSGR